MHRHYYLYKVAIHLVSVKVCVVGVAIGVVHAQGLLLHMGEDACLVAHDTGLVQRRLAVHQQRVASDQVAVYLDAGL